MQAAPDSPPAQVRGVRGSNIPSPFAARTGLGSRPPPSRLGPHTWPRCCCVPLTLGPQTLTCPAPLWGRPCACLLRLREPRPPARHISRNRGGGEKGEGWRGEGGLRVPSFPQPSTAATSQKIKKKKFNKKADYTAPEAAPSRQRRLGVGGERVRAPPGEGGGGGGGAGAASELRGLGRGGAPRGGADSGPHLPRSSAAPTEAARVRPGDFPAPSDGGGGGRGG